LNVTSRVCLPPARGSSKLETPPFLQLVGLGEDGIEVYEIPLATLYNRKGKDKEGAAIEATHVQSFVGESAFLSNGGHWHQLGSVIAPQLERADSTASTSSYESIESDEVMSQLRAAAGMYCSLRKDAEDWRVFWVGGDTKDVGEHDEDTDGVLV